MGHIPVLLSEVIRALKPAKGKHFADATFGGGGYSRAFLEAGATVYACDRDPAALEAAADLQKTYPQRFFFFGGPFSRLGDFLRKTLPPDVLLDGVAADFGLSSLQLDNGGRGFSFQIDGPLDMRMAPDLQPASRLVETLSAADLSDIFRCLGQEKKAGRIAKAIVRTRAQKPLKTTAALAGLIEDVLGPTEPRRLRGVKSRIFQALRIAVNGELDEIQKLLENLPSLTASGAVLAFVSFHSLEDRLIKHFFLPLSDRAPRPNRYLPEAAAKPALFFMAEKVIVPTAAEIEINPRAASARLRLVRRHRPIEGGA